MPEKTHTVFNMRIAIEDLDLIKRAAEKEGRTVSSYVRFYILKAAEHTVYFCDPVPGQNEQPVF